MDSVRAAPPDFFSDLANDRRIETAVLLRRNGRLLAAWARDPVSWEVLSIMAATTLGSLETLLETLRSPAPQMIAVVAAGNRIHLQKVGPQSVLVLIAKESVTEAYLRETARRILSRMPPEAQPPRRVTLGPNTH